MTDGKLIGIAVDLSPNYYKGLESYRRLHPESRAGLPGRSGACIALGAWVVLGACIVISFSFILIDAVVIWFKFIIIIPFYNELMKTNRFQGFNTGVVLYNLKAMRESSVYNRFDFYCYCYCY